MKKTALDSKIALCLTVGVIMLLLGFGIGLAFSSGIKIDTNFTMDGLITALTTLIAVIAATVILPLTIQPLIQKQTGIITVTHEDIKSLLDLIQDVLGLCEKLHLDNRVLNIADRQLVLSRHKQIHNLANILKNQAASMPALFTFDVDVFQPLNDSHTDFSDNVVPGKRLTNKVFLDIRGNLDPIVYKLHEIRYKLN